MRAVLLLGLAACSFEHGQLSTMDATGSNHGSDARPLDARPIDAPPMCPADYDGNGYRVAPTATMWLAAEQDCENDGFGTHLIVFASLGDLGGYALFAPATDTWVGMTDRKVEGTWRWVTGAATGFSADMNMDNRDCGSFHAAGFSSTINAVDCGGTQRYVCQCDLHAVDPTAY